ncbi:MAG: sulfoacetaldehyde acetyltransferase [Candidatus Eremiobacteraeota bacterium]|nr:sulfoacetaldehyde acetyltransferase [Candidatus Eremiobacteraeota bacterium]
MTPSEAFVETLVAEGVTLVPGIVGSAYMDALDLFPAAGIRFLPVAHEQNAVHMADGWARVGGRPTAVIAQNGPGITNFVTAVAAAYWAHTPMVVITPSAGSSGVGLGGFQETEQLPIFSKITKWQTQVNRPDRIAELLRRAFYLAKAESGPVQVDIPRDYFYGELETEIYPSLDLERGAGPARLLEEAARALAAATFPVIVAGGGVVQANGVAELRALAEYLTAPVACSYLHNDAFPASHELAVGPLGYQGSKAAMQLLAQADVVLALGTRLGPFGTLPQYGLDYWPKNAQIVQIDVDHRVLGLTKKISLGICGDAKASASQLLELVRRFAPDRTRSDTAHRRIAEAKTAWQAELDGLSSKGGEPISPRRALKLVAEALPNNSIVTTDIGNISSVANSYLRFENPRRFLAAMSFGNCGYSYPTALGAKLGRADLPVAAYVGDGAWGMSLAETMTAVRENIPVVAIVWNNAQWGAEKKNQIDYYKDRYVGTNLENPKFAEVARAMGALGIEVERERELQDAVRTAFDSGKPAVIDLVVDSAELGEPFRRDALKKPTRFLDPYKHLTG